MPKHEGPTTKARGHLRHLRRRQQFLRERLDERGAYSGRSYDEAEEAALFWAIPLVEDEIERLKVEPGNRA